MDTLNPQPAPVHLLQKQQRQPRRQGRFLRGVGVSVLLSVGCPAIAATPNLAQSQPPVPFLARDPAAASALPQAIAAAVLQAVVQEPGVDPAQLQIITAQPQTWSDSCLGLGGLDLLCAEVLVPGWQVVVADRRQQWVYRTNQSGAQVKLDLAASRLSDRFTVQSRPIAANELPPPLPQEIVFRAIVKEGLAGRTQETRLLKNGQILQQLISGNQATAARPIGQLTPAALQQFQQRLEQYQFGQFDQLHYPGPAGATDFITVTFSSKTAIVSYAETVQERLPQDLQQVIEIWTQLTQRTANSNPE